MNAVYRTFVLVVGAAMAQAECLVGVEKPTCIDITAKGAGADCPHFCTWVWSPVCDNEGKTHSNPECFAVAACKAKKKGIDLFIVEEGPCDEPLDKCTGEGCQCPEGMTGIQPFCRPKQPVAPTITPIPIVPTLATDCPTFCTWEWSPVCDNQGKTHINPGCFTVAACEAKKKGIDLFIVREGPCEAAYCPTSCTYEWSPICDNKGVTHGNLGCFAVAACEAKKKGIDLFIVREGSCEVAEVDDCRRCSAYATAVRVTDPTVFIPKCVPGSSLFVKEQYDGAKDESFCVDEKNGREYDESRVKGQTVDCSSFPAPVAKDTPCLDYRVLDYLPDCQDDGFFAPLQCAFPLIAGKDPTYCWCSSASGQLIPMTVHNRRGPRPHPVDCQAFRDFTFDCTGLEGTNQPYPNASAQLHSDWDCTRYIKCSVAGTFSCVCEHGRLWDTTTGTCNDAEKVTCGPLIGNGYGSDAIGRLK